MGTGISKLNEKQFIEQVTDILISNNRPCSESSTTYKSIRAGDIPLENCEVGIDSSPDNISIGAEKLVCLNIINDEKLSRELLDALKNQLELTKSSSSSDTRNDIIQDQNSTISTISTISTSSDNSSDQYLKEQISTFIQKVQQKVDKSIIDFQNNKGMIKCSPANIEQYNEEGSLVKKSEIPGEFDINSAQTHIISDAVTSVMYNITTESSTEKTDNPEFFFKQSTIIEIFKYVLVFIILGILFGLIINKYKTKQELQTQTPSSFGKKNKKIRNSFGNTPDIPNPMNLPSIILSIILLVLSITQILLSYFKNTNNMLYAYGLLANVLIIVCILFFIAMTDNNYKYVSIPLLIYSIILMSSQIYHLYIEVNKDKLNYDEIHIIIRYIFTGLGFLLLSGSIMAFNTN